MIKNKKRLLISILVLFVVWCGVLVYLIFRDNEHVVKENVKGIESITTINNIGVKLGEDFYVKDEGNKLVIYDFDDEVLSEYKEDYSYFEVFDKRLIIITNKNGKEIINSSGHRMATGSNIKYSSDNKYVLVDNVVYDYNMRKLYTLDFTYDSEYNAQFANDLLIIDTYKMENKSVIIDLIEKKVLWSGFNNGTSYEKNGNITYFKFTKDKKGYLLDTKNKQIVYDGITYDNNTYNDYYVFMYEGNVYYIDGDKIYGNNTKITDKYVMSKDTCEIGYKLNNNNNKNVINKCMYVYKVLFDNAILGIDNDGYTLFYKDKEISGGEITLEGDYIKVAASLDILGDGTTYKYYDKDLKQVEVDENISVGYMSNNSYSGYDYSSYSYVLLDKDLKKQEDKLNDISCKSNGYCDISKNMDEHYLYKDGKLVNDTFVSININEDEIILETLYKTYIVKLGNDKNVKLDFSFDFNIDLEDIINKYDLSNIKDKIYENKDLFKKYAFIVENNNMLLDYKKEVYDLFELLVDDKKYLNEFYFLHKLGYLNIHNADVLLDGKAAGTYNDFNTRINLVSNSDRVVYHELVHFVNFSIKKNTSTTLYKCDGKVEIHEAISNMPDNCEYLIFDYSNYITEAGAESFTAKYFTKNIDSYVFATYYLNALEYIYGSDTFNKWFFEDNNYFIKTLYEEFNDEEVVGKIIKALSDTTSIDSKLESSGYLVDILIDLYKKHNGDDYLKDKKFTYLLKPMIDCLNVDKSKYYNEFKNVLNVYSSSLSDLKNKIDYKNYSTFLEPFIINDKMYLSWVAWSSGDVFKSATIWIDYDFDNDKVINYVVKEIK